MDHLHHVESYLYNRLSPVMRVSAFLPEGWPGPARGWEAPVEHEGLFVFSYCPAVIAAATAELHPDERDDYLRAIAACVMLHIINHEVPDDQRVAVVESQLYDSNPGALALLSRIQFAALDAAG